MLQFDIVRDQLWVLEKDTNNRVGTKISDQIAYNCDAVEENQSGKED